MKSDIEEIEGEIKYVEGIIANDKKEMEKFREHKRILRRLKATLKRLVNKEVR